MTEPSPYMPASDGDPFSAVWIARLPLADAELCHGEARAVWLERYDCVATGRLPHGRLLAADRVGDGAIVDHAMRSAGIAELADRQVSTLSGGERQRVHLARALAQEPQLLVLDEPTNHLDVRHQLELLALVRELAVTTLITLHDLNLAAAYCDQIVMLEHGRVVASGAPEDVFTPELLLRVFGVRADTLINPLTGRLQLVYGDR